MVKIESQKKLLISCNKEIISQKRSIVHRYTVYNINRIKNLDSVKIISFINYHNYDCNCNVARYASKYHHLSLEVLDDIKFFTLDSHMDTKIQYRLLIAKYPDIYIHKKDLYNTIYHFKAISTQ